MNATTYAKQHLEQTLSLLNMAAAGMDDAQYNWDPAGTCNSASKSHVHTLTSLDFFINAKVRGQDLLWSTFAPANGLPANPMEIWSAGGVIPLAAITEYGKTLQQSVLDYVSSLSDADLDREVDTQFFGMKPIAFVLQLAGMHCAGHAGDISAVKGMQGLKGIPF